MKKKPNLIIDRHFDGVGRLKRSAGTPLEVVRTAINASLDKLVANGRHDLLRAVLEGQFSLMTLHRAVKDNALHKLPTGKTAAVAVEAMRAWASASDYSDKHKEAIETTARYIERARPKAMIADIPDVVDGLRDSLGRKHPRSFNLARAHALAFLRATVKANHELYREMAAVERRKEKKTAKRNPLTPGRFRELFPAPLTDPTDAVAWGMATTGMGPKEYWGHWAIRPDHVYILGTKRDGRVRSVPRIWTPGRPAMHRRTFEDAVRERSRAFTVYDFRRSFANWMESAGIPRIRRKMYMGHGAVDVTDLYEQHEVTAYLREDAIKLCAYLALPLPASLLDTPPTPKGLTADRPADLPTTSDVE